MYDYVLLNLLRKNVSKPYVYFCPQCGFKTFQFKKNAYVCAYYYCGLELGFTGKTHELRAWKRKMVELIKEGKLIVPQGCDDDDCRTCRTENTPKLSEYQS